MKRILSFLSVSAVLVCCSDLTADETLSGGDNEQLMPLELSFGTALMTKGLVEETTLPNGTSVGVTVRDSYGRYTGEDYTNIRYTSAASSGNQVWSCETPVMLARETGTLFSYWPHSATETDGKTIAVSATSDVQTDYMWGLPVSVNKSNRTASITMQHALAAVRIFVKRGSYSGVGNVSAVAFGGDCAATSADLDLSCGALSDLSGQGTMIAPAINTIAMSGSYQKVSDIIVVPTSGTNGKVVVTLDGVDYPIEFNSLDLNSGEMTYFYLTANDGELFASDITVGDWTYGDEEGNEIIVSPKVKITGDLMNIALHNDVSEDGTVTVYAMSMSNRTGNTTVYPVTFRGSATFSQSLEEETGIRVITIEDIESDVEIQLHGLYLPSPANSYIVSHGGTFSFPTVKGNGSTPVGSVASAEVLWETFGTNKTPAVGDLVKSVTCCDGYISFCTSDTYKEGNAVIAAKDASGTILWSWHIWFTEQPKGQVYYNGAGTMMDRNLGATSATPGDVGALGLLYQWGRKDPFLNSSTISSSTIAKSTITWPSQVASNSSNGTIAYATAHPTTFITSNSNNYDWYYTGDSTTDDTRWTISSSAKSIYDPCPAGWRVPDGGEDGVWSKAYGSSSSYIGTYDSTNEGINFSGEFGDASTIWYPTSGSRNSGVGTLYDVGKYGYCWSTSSSDYDDLVYSLYFSQRGTTNTSSVDLLDYTVRANGLPVRCIKE